MDALTDLHMCVFESELCACCANIDTDAWRIPTDVWRMCMCAGPHQRAAWRGQHRPWPAQDSSLESPAPEADAVSIRPTGQLIIASCLTTSTSLPWGQHANDMCIYIYIYLRIYVYIYRYLCPTITIHIYIYICKQL